MDADQLAETTMNPTAPYAAPHDGGRRPDRRTTFEMLMGNDVGRVRNSSSMARTRSTPPLSTPNSVVTSAFGAQVTGGTWRIPYFLLSSSGPGGPAAAPAMRYSRLLAKSFSIPAGTMTPTAQPVHPTSWQRRAERGGGLPTTGCRGASLDLLLVNLQREHSRSAKMASSSQL
jgi:hypothetical protein